MSFDLYQRSDLLKAGTALLWGFFQLNLSRIVGPEITA